MSFFGFRWLHKLIRRNSRPIPAEDAELWRNRISIGYAFIAWNAFGFVCYKMYEGKADWAASRGLKSPEEIKLTPGQQWAKTLNIKNAEIYRISGFSLQKIDGIQENKDATVHPEDSEVAN